MVSVPPPLTSTEIATAAASRAFSTSSLTTEAGRSTTSPAAILAATSGARTRIVILSGIVGSYTPLARARSASSYSRVIA